MRLAKNADDRNSEREMRIELGIKGMRRATGRMADDLKKAPRKKYPRQYAESAINDAEFVVEGEREIAKLHIERMEGNEGSVEDRRSFFHRLEAAESECATLVSAARVEAQHLWPTLMD